MRHWYDLFVFLLREQVLGKITVLGAQFLLSFAGKKKEELNECAYA